MKSKKKWVVSLLLVLFMVMQSFVPVQFASAAVGVNTIVPLEATTYAYKHYKEIVDVVKAYQESYNITEQQLKQVELGTGFVIYELNESVQDEIYYFPILDANKNIILLMSVIGTTNGWSISASEQWVDELKQIGQITSDYIFYKSGENLIAETQKKTFAVSGSLDSNLTAFHEKAYQVKKDTVKKVANRFHKTDVNNITINAQNMKATYTPGYSSSTSSSKICSLNNSKGQGYYGLCWAATVATISNYIKGTNTTAQQVANLMGIGYNDGATPAEAQQALKNYGLYYNNLNMSTTYRMTWDSLKTNIDNKYPVYVDAKASKSAHAVTAYGYSIAAGSNYVVLWNPGASSGNGSSVTVSFKSNGTTFAYNNTTYTWTYSVSQY